jgi:uncharacterized lipoprotein YmbA
MHHSQPKRFAIVTIAGLCISILLSACGSSPASRYYLLEEQVVPSTNPAAEPLVVRVGPIRMARYVQRPQIVTRLNDTEVSIAEYDRWAEPLEQGFQRVLTNNLADDLGSPRVHEFGSGYNGDPFLKYRVSASIMRFDVDENNTATLDVQWALAGKQDDEAYLVERSLFTLQAASTSYSDRAIAMSQLIAVFSQTIADNILQVDTDTATGRE